jgi:putative tricarboxylic transport membrane protein
MGDRLLATLVLLLAAVYLYATSRLHVIQIGDPVGIKMFPTLIGIAAVAATFLLVGEIVRSHRHRSAQEDITLRQHRPAIVLAVLVWILVYTLTFQVLGYVISSSLFLFGLLIFFHPGKWGTNATISILFSVCIFITFTKFLGINLPQGLMHF